ncbi:MAG: hypothetical protein L0219_04835 [Phycisphaerales bacterium]|nr:hypothetical protein [Phycisphaerales bacterium]
MREAGFGEHHVGEGVIAVGVEAGGDEHELGFVGVGDGDQETLIEMEVGGVVEAGWERRIDGEAFAGAVADLVEVAGVGEEAVLVGTEEENISAVIEGVLGAVAVMDIPVDDEDALKVVVSDGMRGGDGDVVEETKAHGLSGFGVVAWGADEGEGATDLFW